MLKLKLQYFAPWCKNWLLGRDPDAGKEWEQEEKGATKDDMLDGIIDSTDMSFNKLWEIVTDREARPWGCKESDMTEELNNHAWMALNNPKLCV